MTARFGKRKSSNTVHIRQIHIQKNMNNNKIERLNGEIESIENLIENDNVKIIIENKGNKGASFNATLNYNEFDV